MDGLPEELPHQVQLEGGLDGGAAALRGDRRGQLVLAVVDDAQRALEDETPAIGVGGAPGGLRALGGAVGQVDLRDRRDGYGRELLTVVRIEVDDVPGTAAGPPFTADVLVGQLFKVGVVGHAIPI